MKHRELSENILPFGVIIIHRWSYYRRNIICRYSHIYSYSCVLNVFYHMEECAFRNNSLILMCYVGLVMCMSYVS